MLGSSLFTGLALLGSSAFAAPKSFLGKRQNCTFSSATTPECWDGTFDLTTNWYEEAPDTGVVREYFFELTNTTGAPDGVDRMILAINGSVPGPTIIADWGDTVVVHLTNSLQNNGTSMHFHGIRMNHTNGEDGVASITQCPTAPGETITYTWKATQYGSSWYHSHFALQAWNGFFGGIVINGPATAPYDEDKGILMLGDWLHQTTDELYPAAATGGPPQSNNGLINGTNTYEDGGSRFLTTFESGTSYRFRLVNHAIDTHFKFFIDGHTFTVIAADFVPIEPYTTDSLSIGIGQRYDIIVNADQEVGNYWMRAIPQLSCSASNEKTLDILGIVRYDGAEEAEPTGDIPEYNDDCLDEDVANLVPAMALDAGTSSFQDTWTVGLTTLNGQFKWTINSQTFLSDWGYPTVQQVVEGNTTYDAQQNIVELNDANQWVSFIIDNPIGLTHPIHLHGHDFWVLKQSTAAFDESEALDLQTVNAPRRDVVMLPGGGHVVIGFYTDNPGVWLMHCHIGWHTSEGFALQLVERFDEIEATLDTTVLFETCAAWNAYAEENGVEQEDSGV